MTRFPFLTTASKMQWMCPASTAFSSGPNVIMPSEWMRWVWDSTGGKQSPKFTSEKQAQRILDLLMRHANDIAVTLTQFPQYY